ncbi:helicase associated domain-containing protein [Streptomyces sp. SP18CS02]|uniref:helicase associated domain-containing protein n=1 Tax=Streptomyces sp. SP18CS02 TaxID=3002531 RepID=UPI003FCDCC81
MGESEAVVPIGQHMADRRRMGDLGKDPQRAAACAQQLTAIAPDRYCPWPLSWQRHYQVLADPVDADGVLSAIEPGVLFEGDDIGRWLQRQKNPGTWAQLSTEQQQERLSKLGVQPDQAAARATTAPSKAQQVFQRDLTALTQWVEREGADRPVPRGHSEQITVDGEAEPVTVKLGVWISNTKSRRDRLDADQLAALAKLGMDWAKPVTVPQAAPDGL